MCEHPISIQQNQHNLSQWIIPTLLPSISHAGLLQHPIYIFIGQLSPSLVVCLGAGRSVMGNLSHSLIERLSGDYGEVRNKVVLRNHKHKPFSLGLLRNIISSAAAVYHRFFSQSSGSLSLLHERFRLEACFSYCRRGNRNGRKDDSAAPINFPLFSSIFHASDVS